MKANEPYDRLVESGIKPSLQRIEIMRFLMKRRAHYTVEEVYNALCGNMPTLSRTTVYNTLRLFADHKAAQMLTIDERRVFYDGETSPHAHFYCRECGKVTDLEAANTPVVGGVVETGGNLIDEVQLYYKGLCAECRKKENRNK